MLVGERLICSFFLPDIYYSSITFLFCTFIKILKLKIMDGKTKAIVAHIFWIGWIISLVVNMKDKDEIASFYIRQLLGIYLFSLAVTILASFVNMPMLSTLGGIVTLVFWVLSLISAIQGEKKEVPIVGNYFQEWFKTI